MSGMNLSSTSDTPTTTPGRWPRRTRDPEGRSSPNRHGGAQIPGPADGFPMPLWLQGVVEFTAAAVVGALLTGVLMTAVWSAGGFGSLGMADSARLAGQMWLLAHFTPLSIAAVPDVNAGGGGVLTLLPLGLSLVPFALAVLAGRRIARACWRGQFLTPWFAGMVAYAVIGAVVALLSRTDRVSASIPAAALLPLIPVGLGVLVGGWSVSRSLAAILGADAASWLQRTSQYSRWAGSYVWAAVRAGFLSAVAVIGAGALLTVVTLVWHWDRIITSYQQLGTDAAGDTALTALQFGYLPNMVVWAAAWASGAGFAVGADTITSPLQNTLGAIPQLPILAAVPQGTPWPYAVTVLVLPLLAGVLGGWWFLREGENHLDDWMAIRLPMRWLTFLLSTLLTSALIAAIGAGLVAALAWLSHGSLGLGRLSEIGPNPWHTFLWTGAELLLGAFVGYVLGPWLERDGYRDNPWNSSVEHAVDPDVAPRNEAPDESSGPRDPGSTVPARSWQDKRAEARARHAARKSAERKAARLEPPASSRGT